MENNKIEENPITPLGTENDQSNVDSSLKTAHENGSLNEKICKKIRHIVISGGGIAGFSFYGGLRETSKHNLWNINDIKTIYGTSIGAIFATIISLKYDWDILDDFLIKRPWHQVYNFDIQKLFLTFQSKGIFNKNVIKETFLPLFKGKDISIDVTLKEFYEITNIENHYFATNINSFDPVDFSYKTHPDWKLIDAIYSSCALPILLQPFITEDGCYSDGGLFTNYPVDYCIKNGADPDEILGVTRCSVLHLESLNITEHSSLIDYIFNIFYKVTESVLNDRKQITKIKYEIDVFAPPMSIYHIYFATSNMEERIRLINVGVESVSKLISTI
jgi:predicted acylesterase/phospholipase RssA